MAPDQQQYRFLNLNKHLKSTLGITCMYLSIIAIENRLKHATEPMMVEGKQPVHTQVFQHFHRQAVIPKSQKIPKSKHKYKATH